MNDFVGNILHNAYCYILLSCTRRCTPVCGAVMLLLQPLRWCCADCVIHHERDLREE